MENFFDKTYYSNNEFQNMIQKEHYPVHLNIQMYYKNSDVNEINNYDQFLISSCQLTIFIIFHFVLLQLLVLFLVLN